MTTAPTHHEIYRSLGQLEGRMEGLEEKITDGFQSLHDKIDSAFSDHENRIRTVEKVQEQQRGSWKTLTILGGIAAAVGGFLSGIWGYLTGAGG